MRRLSALLLCLVFAFSCSSDGGELDENGKPTLDPSGRDDPTGKADGLAGVSGLPVSVDSSSTAVWEVTRDWTDINDDAGPAWVENSGLTWDQKYRAWVDSLEKDGSTFIVQTPYGKSLPAPSLECAEVAMFLRIAFASWYHLPFFMEAHAGGERVFFGHFGVRTKNGRWGQMPNFKTRFQDHEHLADAIRDGTAEWPRDNALRQKSIPGSAGDAQPQLFDGATAGTYFDEAFLNKRVGHFLRLQLAFMGSIHLADTANAYNIIPEAISPGDILVERWQASGIGHTVVVKERKHLGEAEIDGKIWPQIDVEVVSGFMPRRQPRWENSVASRGYATNDLFGGEDHAKFGGGLKRWRSARKVGAAWTNSVLPVDSDLFIARTGTPQSTARLERRVEDFENIIVVLTPEERMGLLAENIENERSHLRNAPSSCAARIRREEAFHALYEVGEELGMTRTEIDSEFRKLDDYVFSELVYTQSKTCCWNSSTSAMYDIAMELSRQKLEGGSCSATVFMNRDDDQDGYEVFRTFAESIGRGSEWVSWSADETCPQSGVRQDTPATAQPTDLCDIVTDVLSNE